MAWDRASVACRPTLYSLLVRPRLPSPIAVIWLILLLGTSPAVGIGGHPRAPTARPLHQRLALADAAVVARVEAVEPGRIGLHTERVLLGRVPERFQVKRSPGRPPPLEAGDRAILMLRGARSPYVLSDESHETIRLADAAMARRWSAAVEALVRSLDTPERWVELYVGWIDSGPDTLRELALAGLADREAPFQPLGESLILGRAAAALDRERPAEARRMSALLAVRSAAGASWLLERVGCGSGDQAVAAVALQGGALHRSPELDAALARCADSPEPSLRQLSEQLRRQTSRGR